MQTSRLEDYLNRPVYHTWRKNEIARPVSFGMYWVLFVLAMLYIVLSALAPPASAYNVSFSSIDGAADRDLFLYNNAGVLIGQYNTTSTVTINNDSVVIFKPQTADPLESPSTWLTGSLFPWVKTNATALIILGFLILLFVSAARRV